MSRPRHHYLGLGAALVALGSGTAMAGATSHSVLQLVEGALVGAAGVVMLIRANYTAYAEGRDDELKQWLARIESARGPLANGHAPPHDELEDRDLRG